MGARSVYVWTDTDRDYEYTQRNHDHVEKGEIYFSKQHYSLPGIVPQGTLEII